MVTQLKGDKKKLFKNYKFADWTLILDYNNMWSHLNKKNHLKKVMASLVSSKISTMTWLILTNGLPIRSCTITIHGFSKGPS